MTTREQRQHDIERLKAMTDEEAAEFWDTHDFTDYLEFLGDAEVVATPKTWKETMTIRLDVEDITLLKEIATEKGIGASTLVRMIVKQYLQQATHASAPMP